MAMPNSKHFPVQNSEKSYTLSLETGNWDSAVLHFGVDDLMQKTRSKSDTVENLMEHLKKAAVKCMLHGVSKVSVSAIVRQKRIPFCVLE